MELQGAIAIITGASGGIGATTARELARQGATVVLGARRMAELQAVADEIGRQGGRALAVQTDVAHREEIDRLVQTALDTYGRVDVLVNNAGIGTGSFLSNTDDAAMERIIDVNVLAVARCTQAVLPQMRRQGSGVIVNLGSVAGEIATGGLYGATKFAVRGLSDALRRELRQEGIAVVLIEPGFVRTEMTADLRFPLPSAELVARAIVDGIRRSRRRIVVPWYYQLLIYPAKLFPQVADWILGSRTALRFYHQRKRTM